MEYQLRIGRVSDRVLVQSPDPARKIGGTDAVNAVEDGRRLEGGFGARAIGLKDNQLVVRSGG